MTTNYKDAFAILRKAQEKLNSQDISQLPHEKQLGLLAAQRDVYLEIQALQVQNMTMRTDQFMALTAGFSQSEAGFEKIRSWAVEAQKAGLIVDGLLKGLSLALSLL